MMASFSFVTIYKVANLVVFGTTLCDLFWIVAQVAIKKWSLSPRTCVEVNDVKELHSDNAFKGKCQSDSN